jgi:hypothetical protein
MELLIIVLLSGCIMFGVNMLAIALYAVAPVKVKHFILAKVEVNYFVIVRRLHDLYENFDARRTGQRVKPSLFDL